MWYESTIQVEREILPDTCKTSNVVWNKVLDVEEPTQKLNKLKGDANLEWMCGKNRRDMIKNNNIRARELGYHQ